MKIIIEKELAAHPTTDENREADALLRHLILMIVGAANEQELRELLNGYDTDYFTYEFRPKTLKVFEVITDEMGNFCTSKDELLTVPFWPIKY